MHAALTKATTRMLIKYLQLNLKLDTIKYRAELKLKLIKMRDTFRYSTIYYD